MESGSDTGQKSRAQENSFYFTPDLQRRPGTALSHTAAPQQIIMPFKGPDFSRLLDRMICNPDFF